MIGKYPAKLDDKNRLFVPATLRAKLGDDFNITLKSSFFILNYLNKIEFVRLFLIVFSLAPSDEGAVERMRD